MKAVIFDKQNSQGQLVLREVKKPVPRANEVLVKIFSTAVNAADYRSMRMRLIPKRGIFGADIAGIVEETGTNTKNLKVGDEVFGDTSGYGFGGFAEYASISENLVLLKPAAVTFDHAAALPMAAVTALQALRDKGRIQPGHKVLIYGAGGGVGTFAVQFAKVLGGEVTAVCGTKNVELVRSLGADRVIDYSREDFSEAGKPFDLILGVNGNRPLSVYKHALAPGGVFVMVGGEMPQIIKTLIFGVFMSIGSKKIRSLPAKPNRNDLEYIVKLVETGKIKPVIDRTYPFSETAEGMRYASEGHARGKIVIKNSSIGSYEKLCTSNK